jgi:hypothetical protein
MLKTLRETVYLADPGIDGRLVLKWMIHKQDDMAENGVIWFRAETNGELL